MKNNWVLMKVLCVIVIIICAINLAYYKVTYEKNNFSFIKSEIISDNVNSFNLQFLTNKGIDELYIKLPEISSEYVAWTMDEVFNKNGFKGYVININLDKLKLSNGSTFNDDIKTRDIVITTIYMDNGSGLTQPYDIGKVTLSKRAADIKKAEKLKYLTKELSIINENDESVARYKASEDISLDIYNKEQLNKILDFGALKINDKDINEIVFPLVINKNDVVEFKWKSSKFTSFDNKTIAKRQSNGIDDNTIELFTNYLDLSFYIIPKSLGKNINPQNYNAYVNSNKIEVFTWFYEMFKLPTDNFKINNSIFKGMRGEH